MRILYALAGEIRKQLHIMWSYRFANLFDIFGYSILYIAAMFIIGQGDFEQAQLQLSFIGYIVTFFILEMLNHMAYETMDEALEGTLEQMYMGANSPLWLLVGQAIAVTIKSILSTLVMGVFFVLLFQIDASFLHPVGLVILLVILLGVMGFGFIIAGMTIVFKQIGSVVSVMFNLILFLNGTFLAVDEMPTWMQAPAQAIPTTQGIVVLRRVLLEDAFWQVLQDGSFALLLLHSAVYLLMGIAIYLYCERHARREGSLGHY